jgi:hypothetical protein
VHGSANPRRRWPAHGARLAATSLPSTVGYCAPARVPALPVHPLCRRPARQWSRVLALGQGGAPNRTNDLDRGPGSGSAPRGSTADGMDRPRHPRPKVPILPTPKPEGPRRRHAPDLLIRRSVREGSPARGPPDRLHVRVLVKGRT